MAKSRSRSILFVGALLVIAVLAALLLWPRDTENQDLVRVGYVPVSTALPLFVAQQEGLFAAAGVEVETSRIETGNQAVEALITGRIDATAVVADLPWLTIAQRDPDLFRFYAWSVLDAEIPMDMILVPAESDIQSLMDLRGKTVATFPGSQLKSFLSAMLVQRGIEPDLVNIVELPPQNQLPALASGSADALFCLQPICTLAQDNLGARPIEASPIGRILGNGRPIAAASFGLSTDFIRERPDTARRFVEAMWRAIELVNADQARYRSLYPSFAPIPEALAPRVPVTKFMTSRDWDRTVVEREIRALRSANLLTAPIEIDRLVYRPEQ